MESFILNGSLWPDVVTFRPPARAVLTRLPPSLGNQSIVEALFSLVASASERQYDRVYPKAEALVKIAQAISSPDYDISTVVTTLTTSFIGTSSRSDLLNLILYILESNIQ